MPEGDTVNRTATRLDQALAGQPLTRLDLRWGQLGGRTFLPAATLNVTSRGKHVLHRLDTGWTVHTHLRMEGSWRIMATPEVAAAALHRNDLRAIAATARWTAFGLRLGLVEVWPSREEAARLGYLGPDILGDDWDLDEAVSRARSPSADDPSGTLGAALLDQRNLAGLGTFWTSEALFHHGLPPWQPAADVSADSLAALLTRAQGQMRIAAETGVQSATGSTRPGELAAIHGRSGRPCRRCGTTLRIAQIGPELRVRWLPYCPTCQGGLAPTDDGRPIRPLGSAPRARRR
jgi:endonuclease-8